MSIIGIRAATGSGTINVGLADLPDGSKAIEHVVLGADGNPIVPVQDASIAALVTAVAGAVSAAQAFVIGRTTITLVDAFGTPVATTSVLNGAAGNTTDVLGALLASLPKSPPNTENQAWLDDNGVVRVS